ncbi:sensor histidine kinase [Sphaerisporangium flaviroseum]|uniref:Oxygen sensor histidine kinase NreB n=2 Tax=Sphaerisporangium flaviroseum TaxID=509199 RepID=A0ABP7J6G6_9ACTN
MTSAMTRSYARRSAAEQGNARSHAWEAFHGWEILFMVAFLVTVAFVALDDDIGVAAKAVTITLLAMCTVAYLAVGRRAIKEDDDRAGLIYTGLVVVAFVPATIIAPAALFGLFAVCPQLFMLLRSRWALAAMLIIYLPAAIRFLARPDLDGRTVLTFVASAAVTITFAMVIGPWITRIIAQSAERAQLIEELEASRAEVERLSRERGALAERERLAGEIHDTLAQGFTSIIMLIQAAEAQADPSRHLALAMRTARENLDQARGLITALSPAPLDGSTLEEALGRITARTGEELGVPVRFAAEGASRGLPPGMEVALVRAAQEGLANVRKHAAASSVLVGVEYGEHDVVLRVRDDGRGFDGQATTTGYGLRAMRSHVEQAGGTLDVRSAPGRGTELIVRFPHEEHLP